VDSKGNMLPRHERIKMLEEAGELAILLKRHWPQMKSVARSEGPVNLPEDDDDDDSDDSDDDDSADAGGDDDDDDSSDDDDDSDTKGKKGKKGKKGSDEDDDDDDDSFVRMPRSEVERLRRENRESKREARKREREQRAERERQLAESEQYKTLAEERQERIDELEGELETINMERDKDTRKGMVRKVAKRVNFYDPDDAPLFLDDDTIALGEDAVEKRLKRLMEEKPNLKSKRKGSGAPIDDDEGGDKNGKVLTEEQIKNMSSQEINERWDEVQKALRVHSKNPVKK
jgi:hypothetical protein